MEAINHVLDPWLIIPYRWLDDPVGAWWLGTSVLALACVALGELTLRLGKRLNRASLTELDGQTRRMHDNSLQALKQGDKSSYKAMNKLANEAFGRGFFLKAAMGMASLWPAFLTAGWLEARFQGLVIALPGLEFGVGWPPAFISLYILARLAWGRLKRRLAGRGAKAAPA
ncbi:MAG: hypothetical protein HY794_11410 [Desulfarculus sp.]|nr:hypothetical protein [Desulfarculus sp.]